VELELIHEDLGLGLSADVHDREAVRDDVLAVANQDLPRCLDDLEGLGRSLLVEPHAENGCVAASDPGLDAVVVRAADRAGGDDHGRLALQLLVALAVVEFGAAAANLDAFMNPAQLFVYAIVASVSVPCVATLATLAGEFGWRAALTMSAATLAVAIGAGGILARLLGIA
jgi:hypothetical protein